MLADSGSSSPSVRLAALSDPLEGLSGWTLYVGFGGVVVLVQEAETGKKALALAVLQADHRVVVLPRAALVRSLDEGNTLRRILRPVEACSLTMLPEPRFRGEWWTTSSAGGCSSSSLAAHRQGLAGSGSTLFVERMQDSGSPKLLGFPSADLQQ